MFLSHGSYLGVNAVNRGMECRNMVEGTGSKIPVKMPWARETRPVNRNGTFMCDKANLAFHSVKGVPFLTFAPIGYRGLPEGFRQIGPLRLIQGASPPSSFRCGNAASKKREIRS